MEKTLKFVPKKFIKKRLPVLFLALVPSLCLDGLFVAGYFSGESFIPELVETVDLKATFFAIAANFLLLQSWVIIIYLRYYHNYRRSSLKSGEKGFLYRRFKLMGFVKTDWKNGYGFYYDHYLVGAEKTEKKKNGKMVFYGNFKVVKKAMGTEAICNQYYRKRVVVTGYFEEQNI